MNGLRPLGLLLSTVLAIAAGQRVAATGTTDRNETPIQRLVSPKPENLVARARLLYTRPSAAMPVIEKTGVEVDSGRVFSSDRYVVRFALAGSSGPYDVNVPSNLPVQTFVMENTGNFVKLMFLISPMLAPAAPAEITVSFTESRMSETCAIGNAAFALDAQVI